MKTRDQLASLADLLAEGNLFTSLHLQDASPEVLLAVFLPLAYLTPEALGDAVVLCAPRETECGEVDGVPCFDTVIALSAEEWRQVLSP